MLAFYHSADLDGHCSGAIIKYRFPECKLVGVDYGQPFPWEMLTDPDEDVVMIDFSLQPFDDMLRLDNKCNLTWIDHHKTAIEEANVSRRFFAGVRDGHFAACELAWDVFFRDKPLPLAVRWLGRYDIWKHAETPGSLEFQYGMRLFNTWPEQQDFWQALFTNEVFVQQVRSKGEDLLAYERQQNAKFIAAYGFDVEFDGLKCIAANRGMSNSLLFESIWNHEKYDAMLSFSWKGTSWTVSLYSDKEQIDVSTVCKARGGGGHRCAAGFQCRELPFPLPEAIN